MGIQGLFGMMGGAQGRGRSAQSQRGRGSTLLLGDHGQFGSGAQSIANLWRDQPQQTFNRRYHGFGGGGRRGRGIGGGHGRGGMFRNQWDDFQQRHQQRHRRRQQQRQQQQEEKKNNQDEEKKEEQNTIDDGFKCDQLLNFLLNQCLVDIRDVAQRAKGIHSQNAIIKEQIEKRKEKEQKEDKDKKDN